MRNIVLQYIHQIICVFWYDTIQSQCVQVCYRKALAF